MERGTIKTSAIFIATGDQTSVYRDIQEVPPPLRQKLVEHTTGLNSVTILIADRRGARELRRMSRQAQAGRRAAEARSRSASARSTRRALTWAVLHWAELGLAGTAGALIWLILWRLSQTG